jgi:carbamoyltransferase
MVDDIKDALECFGATPVDLLAIGPFVLRRSALKGEPSGESGGESRGSHGGTAR